MTSKTTSLAPTSPLTRLTLRELRDRTSMKWRTHPEDVLPLWVAEMDVLLAPSVTEALMSAISRGDTGYPAATHSYAVAVAAFAQHRWGWTGLAVERTKVVPDVMMGVVELLRLVSGPGDVVVVTPPVYAPFYAFATHADRRVMEAPLTREGRIDPAALEETFLSARAVSDHPVFLLSNPHNPTGVAHSRTELETVAVLARRHAVRVISDEIHAPLVLPGATFTPYLSIAGAEDAFALLSASKAWNLAGLKAALAVAGPEAAADLTRMPEEVSHGPSHLGVIAHTAAFATATGWLDDVLAGLAHNRDLLGSLVRKHLPTVRYTAPEATYLAWLDCAALGLAPPPAPPTQGPAVVTEVAGPARFFLDRARVALSSGHVFGTGGEGHVRLNFATHPEILVDAVTRMGDALADRADPPVQAVSAS